MASVLMTVKGSEHLGGDLSIDYPVRWFSKATALDQASDDFIAEREYTEAELRNAMGRADFTYPNFDDLVDAPVQLGNFPVFKFDVNGVPHEVAMVGRNNADVEKLRDDMQLMCRTMAKVVNDHPCKRYTFIVQNVENGGGGLEHKNSTVLMMSRWAYTDAARYKGFLGLVAHEYFHLWNVKRIRPAELGPFNYRQENYTDLLWLAEGITSYYDEIALMRAGIVTSKEFLGTMAGYVNAHENRMGARVATISEMSHDAWIKEYRPNENSKNSTYSYYSKGVVVGFLFDAWIAASTKGSKHLDDVMQYLWRTHYKNKALGEEGAGITRSDAPRSLPESGKTVKRQRSLNEIFAPTTNKDAREKNQVNEPGASKLVPPLTTQTKRDDTTQALWVRNLFGAKQGQRWGAPQCQEASKRCAECSSVVVNCTMRERCVRCKIPTYCGSQAKEEGEAQAGGASRFVKEHT